MRRSASRYIAVFGEIINDMMAFSTGRINGAANEDKKYTNSDSTTLEYEVAFVWKCKLVGLSGRHVDDAGSC